MPTRTIIVALLAAAGLLLPACADVSKEEETTVEPAHLVTVDGSDDVSIVVEPEAVERIGIRTAAVETGSKAGQTLIPAAAVYYGVDGTTWTYTNPEEGTYQRSSITIEDIQGDVATLSEGPNVGTQVVIVGAAELFGVEAGVDH